jgi:hypothetical protein
MILHSIDVKECALNLKAKQVGKHPCSDGKSARFSNVRPEFNLSGCIIFSQRLVSHLYFRRMNINVAPATVRVPAHGPVLYQGMTSVVPQMLLNKHRALAPAVRLIVSASALSVGIPFTGSSLIFIFRR